MQRQHTQPGASGGAHSLDDAAQANSLVTALQNQVSAPQTLVNSLQPKVGGVGAWFGIARPRQPPAGDTSPQHLDLCVNVCGLCPAIPGTLPPEIPMMTTLLQDGTILEDDAGQLTLFRTTAHGKWIVPENDGLPDVPGTTRYRATFLWLGQTPPALGVLDNAVRTRFVTYFDPNDPDRMLGFIQPYFFPIATGGIVNVIPANPADPVASNHIPAIDPEAELPSDCQLDKGCLGTYHFVLRRTPPK
jgi:hypothetical protein